MELDNESNQSQPPVPNSKKPINRRLIVDNQLSFSSDFDGGNLAQSVAYLHPQLPESVVIEIRGNPDVGDDIRDKVWFYFSVSGMGNYQSVLLVLQNGNAYRKFLRQKKYRPYIVVQEEGEWKPIYATKFNNIVNQVIQVQFTYYPSTSKTIYIAANYPYTLKNLHLHQQKIISLQSSNKFVYFHKEKIAISIDLHPVYLYTITHTNNILNNSEQQASFGIDPIDKRPYVLKNRYQIVITTRVHPSEVSSSFFLEGLVQSLFAKDMEILLQIFIFRIIPMVNPDGVENGHYRRDNHQQNLNRFYGHSCPDKTPSVFAIEALISYLRQREKLFMFFDIHGHNSPKQSFIIGNFTTNFLHAIENRTFCKLFSNLSESTFSYIDCQFSRKNMKAKQKYDHHSKEASARVFAYQGVMSDSIQNSGSLRQCTKRVIVEHSYTVEIAPYVLNKKYLKPKQKSQLSNSFKKMPQINQEIKKQEQSEIFSPITTAEVMETYKKLGRSLLLAIMQLIGVNKVFAFLEGQDGFYARKFVYREILKSGGEYCVKGPLKITKKTLSLEILKSYANRFENFLDSKKIKEIQYDDYFLFELIREKQKQESNKKVISPNFPFNKGTETKPIEYKTSEEEQEPQTETFIIGEEVVKWNTKQFKLEKKENPKISTTPNKQIYLSLGDNNNFQEIKKKIRKIIRHKTDNEINGRMKNQSVSQDKNKIKKCLSHLSTEGNQPVGPILDDEMGCIHQRQQNPHIEKIMKRISVRKSKEMQTISHSKHESKKKDKERNSFHPKNKNGVDQYISINSKMKLPSVFAEEDGERQVRNKLPSSHKSIKVKINKSKVDEKLYEPEVNELADSFRIIANSATNRMDFIVKAKKMLAERKVSRNQNSPTHFLPTIQQSEFPLKFK